MTPKSYTSASTTGRSMTRPYKLNVSLSRERTFETEQAALGAMIITLSAMEPGTEAHIDHKAANQPLQPICRAQRVPKRRIIITYTSNRGYNQFGEKVQ